MWYSLCWYWITQSFCLFVCLFENLSEKKIWVHKKMISLLLCNFYKYLLFFVRIHFLLYFGFISYTSLPQPVSFWSKPRAVPCLFETSLNRRVITAMLSDVRRCYPMLYVVSCFQTPFTPRSSPSVFTAVIRGRQDKCKLLVFTD